MGFFVGSIVFSTDLSVPVHTLWVTVTRVSCTRSLCYSDIRKKALTAKSLVLPPSFYFEIASDSPVSFHINIDVVYICEIWPMRIVLNPHVCIRHFLLL